MEIRNLGGSGLRVSAVGLGCNNFGQRTDLEASRKVIHKAIDLGITLFDTADIYAGMGGSETVLGEVLGDRRKDIVLATKYSKPMSNDGTKQGASRRYIMSAVEASLKRLKTDYIDLYQQHDYDPLTPIEETLRALDDLVRQGKVRYIGNSNFPAWRIAEAELVGAADERQPLRLVPGRIQPRGARHRKGSAAGGAGIQARPVAVLPARERSADRQIQARRGGARRHPLRQGAARCATATSRRATRTSSRSCRPSREARGHTMLELAFSWLAARPQVSSVIAGATRVEQVEQNVKAIELEADRGRDRGDRQDYEVGCHSGAARRASPESIIPVFAFSTKRRHCTISPPGLWIPGSCFARPGMTNYPTNPCIGFAGALSGNTFPPARARPGRDGRAARP